jgi:regulator of protease activity HflC (stomatin/prohibitin superfamily)
MSPRKKPSNKPPLSGESKMEKLIGFGIALAIALMLAFSTFFTVDPGAVGVTFNRLTGKTEVCEQGVHGKIPLITAVWEYDVRTQKDELEAQSSSKDLQSVKISLAVNYHLLYDKVNEIHTKVGPDYANRVIHPAVFESVKAASALFPVEQIIVQRETLKGLIEKALGERLTAYHVVLESVNLVNIEFDPEFSKAVESKQIEEQKIKTAQYQRLQAEEYKKKTILEAEAESQSQRLLALATTKDVIALKMIEKWDGQMPQIMTGGGSNMLMNIGNLPTRAPKPKSESKEADKE